MAELRLICGGQKRAGGMMALIAALLPILVIFVGLFINIAYMELTRTELRIATDAAARAGGRELVLTGDLALARLKAQEAASRNTIAGEALLLANEDIQFGQSLRESESSRYQFSSGGMHPNSIEVRGRRTNGSPSGAVSLFLPTADG